MSKYDNIVGEFGLDDIQELAEDVQEGWYVFLITFFTCVLVTLLYSMLIYHCTGALVWLSIILTGLCFFGVALKLTFFH